MKDSDERISMPRSVTDAIERPQFITKKSPDIVIFRHSGEPNNYRRSLTGMNTDNSRLSYIGFRRFEPSPILKRYVQCYWMIKTEHPLSFPSEEFLHPDGGLGIIFNFGDPFYFDGNCIGYSVFLDGTHIRTRRLTLNGRINAIGIRFLPGAAYPFVSTCISDVRDSNTNLEEIRTCSSMRLYQEIRRANSSRQVADLIERWLRSLLWESPYLDSQVSKVIKVVKQSEGKVPILRVIKDIGRSSRQIERLFKKYVGMTPKQYARIIRVEYARTYLKKSLGKTCAEIGYDSGFYDQAHFTKEFLSITGMSPKKYRDRYVLD